MPDQEAMRGEEPWEQNACFTIKAESEEACEEIARKLNSYARKIGAGRLFCDYSGPQSNDGPRNR